MTNRARQSGQSLFEVVIAVVIVSVVLISLVHLANIAVSNSTFSKNKNLAGERTQELTEWLRGERDRDWNVFVGHASSSKWCLRTLSWTTGGSHTGGCAAGDYITGTVFLRSVNFAVVDPNTVRADVTTSWNDTNGTHLVTTSNLFTNWKTK